MKYDMKGRTPQLHQGPPIAVFSILTRTPYRYYLF